jgi:putative MATE family efflux protein
MLENNYRAILAVALPLMLGTFIQSIVMISDAAILSRYSDISFGASGNAGLLYVTLFMGLSGLGDAGQIIMARRIGENNRSALDSVIQSSIFFNLLMSALFFALVYFFLPNFIDQIVENIEIADEEKKFLRIRSWGFFVAAVFLALNGFFLAIGKTWVIMVSTITFAVSNIIFDYLLVFGVGIFPEMGIEGAALASVIGELFAVMVMLAILFGKQFHISYTLFQAYAVTKSQVNRLLKVGLPLMIQGFLALATWTVFFTWIEHMGRFELTVSHNIRSVYFIAFVPIFGFGATTKTYVSQYLGHHQGDQIKSILRKIQLLSVACLLLLFHGALFYPTQLISLINPDEAFTAESGAILRLVFGSILIYAFISPYFQTINGSGNTRVTLIIEILSILIYLSAAYTFIKILELHIVDVWFVEYIYFGTIGLFSILYLRLFNWKKKVF